MAKRCCAPDATRTPCRRWNRPSPWRRNWNRPAPCMRARCATRSDTTRPPISSCIWSRSLRTRLWQRSAIGALSQAGRPREAEALFERYVAQRGLRLPPTFREALDQLDERLDSAPIPQARLDWAWSLRGDAQADRKHWEPRALGPSGGSSTVRLARMPRGQRRRGHAAAGRTGHRRTVRAAAGGGPGRGGRHRPRRSHVRRPDGAGIAGHSVALAGDGASHRPEQLRRRPDLHRRPDRGAGRQGLHARAGIGPMCCAWPWTARPIPPRRARPSRDRK